MKQSIFLGNIITMDEKRPFAKAALVKNGVFAYIGSVEEVKKIASRGAQVLDYGDNFIYPGFMEAHAHGVFAGYRAIGQANLAQVGLKADYAKYREIIKENSDSSRAVTAMALAQQSGFHSYSTFSNAFKKHTGTTVTEWMKG